jgi:hypothetical protein
MTELKWEITPQEKRFKIDRFIKVAWFPFVCLAVSYLVIKIFKSNLQQIITELIIAIVVFVLIIAVNKIFPYKTRTYFLNEGGLVISKGNKQKKYFWNDFECFYNYSQRDNSWDAKQNNKKSRIFMASKTVSGDIFYLKRKAINISDKLRKVFVVVYTETENNKQVNEFLSNHLSIKDIKSSSDLGLVHYEFK